MASSYTSPIAQPSSSPRGVVVAHEHELARVRRRAEVVALARRRPRGRTSRARRRSPIRSGRRRGRRRPAVAVAQPDDAVVDPRERVRRVVERLLAHPPVSRSNVQRCRYDGGKSSIESPPHRRVPAARRTRRSSRRRRRSSGGTRSRGRRRTSARRRRCRSGARSPTRAPYVVVPAQRDLAAHRRVEVEHDGQVHEDGVVPGDHEVVHHRRPGAR